MVKRKYRIIDPVRFWILIGILILSIVFSIAFAQADREYTAQIIYVEAGDTLWHLAQEYNNTDMEIREYIDRICRLNNITADIRPGQTIKMIRE